MGLLLDLIWNYLLILFLVLGIGPSTPVERYFEPLKVHIELQNESSAQGPISYFGLDVISQQQH